MYELPDVLREVILVERTDVGGPGMARPRGI